MTLNEIELKPLDPAIEKIVIRLESLIPIFKAHTPDGWRDFRDLELTLQWRGGVYVRTDGEDGILEMKGAFGCEAAARLAASQFYAASGRMAEVESGGERMWFARIKMPLDKVNW